jgi:anti-sigma B factor antagonist
MNSSDRPTATAGDSESDMEVGISREALEGGASVFVIEGEVDLASAERLRDALTAPGRNGAGTVIVDLARCSFLDSSGLRALLEAKRALAERAGAPRLLIAAPGRQPKRLLEMTAVESLVPIFDTREEAEAAARSAPRDGGGPASS